MHAAVSHGVLAEGAVQRIEEGLIVSLLMTDGVESQPVPPGRLDDASMAPLFAEAIRRIQDRESISVLFRDP